MTRILGIDPGTKRCGIAISNASESIAFPRPALAMNDQFVSTLRVLIEEEEVGEVVIGRPVALSGNETSSTAAADLLYKLLKDSFPSLPVVQVDERLSTVEASRALSAAGLDQRQQKSHIDSAAAVLLLQSLLESRNAD